MRLNQGHKSATAAQIFVDSPHHNKQSCAKTGQTGHLNKRTLFYTEGLLGSLSLIKCIFKHSIRGGGHINRIVFSLFHR